MLLMGLRYPKTLAAQILERVSAMEESTTVQWFLDRGEARGHKDILFRLGSKRFGLPQPNHTAAMKALTEDDLEKLKMLIDRVLDVASWDELLATP